MDMFIFWFLASVACGFYGSSKGLWGFGWFLASMFFSPFIGFLFCAIADDLKHPQEAAPTPETHVKCPDCRELVLHDARKCKHCGTALIPQ